MQIGIGGPDPSVFDRHPRGRFANLDPERDVADAVDRNRCILVVVG
jgi:hypothetical protein